MSQTPAMPAPESQYRSTLLRALARLAAKGARVEIGDDGAAVIVESVRSEAPGRRHPLAAHILAMACREGWLLDRAGNGIWTLTATGVTELRRALSTPGTGRKVERAAEPAAQMAGPSRRPRAGRRTKSATIANGTALASASGNAGGFPGAFLGVTPTLDPLESPLAWLRCRRDKTGKPFLSEEEFAAGERLRADLWFAQMTPRTTTDWSRFALGGAGRANSGGPGGGLEIAERAVAAQTRVRKALAFVGPDLAGILVDTCAHLKGLSEIERDRGLSQRAGKDVLVLALRSLARHYGYLPTRSTWGEGMARAWHAPPSEVGDAAASRGSPSETRPDGFGAAHDVREPSELELPRTANC